MLFKTYLNIVKQQQRHQQRNYALYHRKWWHYIWTNCVSGPGSTCL